MLLLGNASMPDGFSARERTPETQNETTAATTHSLSAPARELYLKVGDGMKG